MDGLDARHNLHQARELLWLLREYVPTEPATTTSAAPDAAPPGLSGRWQTENPFGERVILTFVGTNYSFNVVGQGFFGEGKISVEGNQIRFYNAFPNQGDGFYEWTVDGDTLNFVALDPSMSLALGGLTWSTFPGPACSSGR